jgi:spermidine synthase
MSSTPRLPAALLLATACSGAAALFYETLWARSLAIALGSTVQANAVIFAAFMVGLALGAYLVGRVTDRLRDVRLAYVAIEVAIALSGCAVGLLLHRYRLALTGLLGAGGVQGKLPLAFVLVLAVVAVPTACMGGTFPLLLELTRRVGRQMQGLYTAYALNTLGAAVGTLAAGAVAIPELGVVHALWLAAGLNLFAAILVAGLGPALAPAAPGGARSPRARELDGPGPGMTRDGWDRALLLGTAFASGLVVLGLEVAWSRLASYFLGNRTLAFTVLLSWVLVLLSLGAGIARRLRRFADRDLCLTLGVLQLGAAAALLLATAASWWWIRHQQTLEPALPGAEALLLVYRSLETGFLLSPLLILGCLFPLSLLSAPDASSRTGQAAGRFYLVNAAGSVAGSLGCGLWGVGSLGTFGWIGLSVALCGTMAFVAFAAGVRGPRRVWCGAGLLGTVVVLNLMAVLLPPRLLLLRPGDELLFRKEDEYGVFTVARSPDGSLRALNNRSELVYHLGKLETSWVQEMQGHLGVVYCPEARTAAVLGSGYGITAGALGLYPSLERVDAVEIVPGMVEAAELFMPYNHGYQRNPKIRVILDDGRHFLARSDARYDIISVNVSDPHQPGGSSLFHEEFYAVAKQHLSERGVLLQHAFGSDLPIVVATLRQAFPYLAFHRAYGNGYNIVAASHPLQPDPAAVARALSAPRVAAALRGLGLVQPADAVRVLSTPLSLSPDELLDVDAALTASDDHPRLEFSYAGSARLWLFSNE